MSYYVIMVSKYVRLLAWKRNLECSIYFVIRDKELSCLISLRGANPKFLCCENIYRGIISESQVAGWDVPLSVCHMETPI